MADAVVLGNLLITLLKNSDRVTSASLAQLVNVIAPIMTEPGGQAWRQTTFFQFSVTSRLAEGVVVRPVIACGTYETEVHGTADLIDSVATFDEESGRSAVFLVNHSQSKALTVTVDARGFGAARLTEAVSLHDDDVYAKNTLQHPDRVGLKRTESLVLEEGILTVTLPAVSWTAIALSERR